MPACILALFYCASSLRVAYSYVIPTAQPRHRTIIAHDRLRPRWRLSHRNYKDPKIEHHELGKKSTPYSLGLKPFIKYKRAIREEVEPNPKGVETQQRQIDLVSVDDGASESTPVRGDPPEIEISTLNETVSEKNATIVKNHTKSFGESKTTGTNKNMKPTNTNLLAQTISESFHFFDEKPNSLKQHVKKAQESKSANENKQTDILSQTISDSVQFLEDNQLLPKGTEQKNDLLAQTILNSFQLFDFDDKTSAKKNASDKKKFLKQPPLVLRNATKTKSKTKEAEPLQLDPSAPLTVADLQQLLNQYGYIRRDEVGSILSNPMQTKNSTNANEKRTKSGVAFPQPSVVSNKHLRIGTMISSGFFFLLLSTTIRPNLWLLGAVCGALYGGDIATKAELLKNAPPPLPAADGFYYPQANQIPGGIYGELSLKSGKKIATTYLYVWDVFQAFWFMYRTGQLSYQYYKTYETVDKRFGIQNKVDAWNARFIEGKENFDKWEQENEVGRKVLAGLRTAWMVEESSFKKQMYSKKGRKKSKYRIVQIGIEILDWYKRLLLLIWGVIKGKSNSELREITKGAMMGFSELNLETFSQRLGAAVAAVVAVNLVGALFAVAPFILGLFAVASGIIWPNWLSGAAAIIREMLEEARARGRGAAVAKKQNPKRVKKEKMPFVKRDTFSYYVKMDGKKKWYRTGQSYREKQKVDDDVEERTWNFNFFG